MDSLRTQFKSWLDAQGMQIPIEADEQETVLELAKQTGVLVLTCSTHHHVLYSTQCVFDTLRCFESSGKSPSDHRVAWLNAGTLTEVPAVDVWRTMESLPADFNTVRLWRITHEHQDFGPELVHPKTELAVYLRDVLLKDPTEEQVGELYRDLIRLNSKPAHLLIEDTRQTVRRHAECMPDLVG